jgi:hypothetical protein
MRIPILEHNDSASFIEWVVRTIDAPESLKELFKVFHKNLRAIGSTAEEG